LTDTPTPAHMVACGAAPFAGISDGRIVPRQATSQEVLTAVLVPTPPDDNPKTAQGIKKPAMSPVPPLALLHLMRAMADGRRKYGLMNWREKPITVSTYYDAAMRHLLSWYEGEERAEDSGVHHLGHVMANMAIILDAEAQGVLNDDRPAPTGAFQKLLKEMSVV
jgi:hypothetical protein